jgi:hypothetical protein
LGRATLDTTLNVKKYTAGPYAGFYTQVCTGETAKWAVTSTIYNRTVNVLNICADGSVMGGGNACAAGTSVGAYIFSGVTWTERNRQHSVSLVERIYNWR